MGDDYGMQFELLGVEDPRWADALSRIRHDVYHLPAYVAQDADRAGGRAVAILATDGDLSLMLPLVLRQIPGSDSWDAVSPYGYPGPASDAPLDATAFWRQAGKQLSSVLRNADVVACFVRWNPLLPVAADFIDPDHGILVQHGATVAIDLELDDATAWRGTRANHRRQILEARRSGMVVDIDDWHRLGEFLSAYHDTMRRVGAEDYYFFDRDYFDGLRTGLRDQVHLVSVTLNGEYLGGGVFFESGGIVQYHLGATRRESLRLHPTKLMFDDVRRWAKARGNRYVHLGGGVSGEGNPLFHFKAGFSDFHPPFYTYRLTTDPQRYAELCQDAQVDPAGRLGYFPAYRQVKSLQHSSVPSARPEARRHSSGDSKGTRHVLVTSAGRRGELVALLQRIGMGRVCAADMSSSAPALYIAHCGSLLPAVADPSYVDRLIDLCAQLGSQVVVPTIDDELPVLAGAAERLADVGVTAMVPQAAGVEACLDKLRTFELLSAGGVPTVPTSLYHGPTDVLTSGSALVVKPRRGSSSKGVRVITDPADLPGPSVAADSVVQPFVEGVEVTIDAVVRADKVLALGARRRVMVRGGEVSRGVTVLGETYVDLAGAVARSLGLEGAFNFQVLGHGDDPLVSDVNPRLGGGLPLSQYAGGRILEAMFGLEDPEQTPSLAKPGRWMLRYDSSVFLAEDDMLVSGP